MAQFYQFLYLLDSGTEAALVSVLKEIAAVVATDNDAFLDRPADGALFLELVALLEDVDELHAAMPCR